MKPKDPSWTHASLKKWVIDYLNAAGHFAWDNKSGGYRRHGVWISYGYKGSSDVLCLMKSGKLLCVEIKIGDDVVKDNQKTFAKEIVSRNGIYLVVRTPADLEIFFGHREANTNEGDARKENRDKENQA